MAQAADPDPRGPVLIGIARAAIERADESPRAAWPQDWLRQPGATFVTLRLEGELRGCIGSLEARRSLGDDVAHNARAAAYRDPRFPPVTRPEWPALGVEVSLLSPRVPMAVFDEGEARLQLRPGIDGVYLEYGLMSSTFLPQVWESLPDPAQFLGQLKRKAGLPADFWHRELRLSRYTVEKFP